MRVSVLPAPDAGRVPASATALVVDVLRATSTLAMAFEHGAARVIPVADPSQALALRARHPGAQVCGEREGRRVDGFDLGNSPFEYTRDAIEGRTLIFASTNGSRAMIAAAPAARRLLAAFVNASAAVEATGDAVHTVIVCAGKFGRPALEDLACAGWLCRLFAARGAALEGAGARAALAAAPASAEEAGALVRTSSHARELVALGAAWGHDVAWCAGVDTLGRVPAL